VTPAVPHEAGAEVPASSDPAVRRGPRALAAAAAALGVYIVLTALWVWCAAKTGMQLPALAIVVGCAAGLTLARLGGAGEIRAALAAALMTLVAAAAGMILTALAVISYAGNASFLTTVTAYNSSTLSRVWAQTGVAGAALGAVGVILAGVVVATLPVRRPVPN
jgi:hypothetical protein